MESINFRNNSLNTFRLLAAVQVLWGHTIKHLELYDIPVLGDFLNFFLGVPIFFTLSGYLIWNSIGRSKSFKHYLKKRFWRIYPELWLAVIIEIIVLLLLYNNPINWPQMGLFTFGQATIFQFWTPDFLRGYGCGTPNGALWTITVLIQFYFCAYFMYKWLHKKRIAAWGGVIVASVIVGWFTPAIMDYLPETIGKLYGITLIPYFWMFLIAAFVAEYRDILLKPIKNYWWLFVILIIVIRYIVDLDLTLLNYPLINTGLLFLALLGFAYSYPQLNIKTDISYGLYIYHMTVVNAFIELGFRGHNWSLWLVIFISSLLAWISTKTIGQMSAAKK